MFLARYGVRLAAIFVVCLLLCAPAGISVNSQHSPVNYALQDIGDDDGDGIPNYLDPDDNDDGITDRDTPPEEDPEEETPPPSNPIEDGSESTDDEVVEDEATAEPSPDSSEPTPAAPDPASSEAQTPATSEPPAQPEVTSFPNTGIGTSYQAAGMIPLLVSGAISLLTFGLWMLKSRSRQR